MLLAAVSSTVYFLRKRAAANKPGDYDDSPDDGFYGPGRPPALPNVEFAPNPVHHGFSTGPPPAGGYAAGLGTGNATGLATGYGAGIGGGGHGAGIGGGHGAGFGGGHDAGISGGHATGYSGGAEQGPYGQPSSNVGSPPIAPQSPPLSDHRVSSTPSGAPLLGLGVGPGGNRQSLQTTSSYNSHPGSYGPHGSSPSPEPGVGPAGGGAAYNTPGSPPTHPGVHEAPDNEVSHESQYELDSSNAVSVPLMAAYPHQQHPAYRHGRQSSYGQQYGGYNHSYQQQHQAISELDGAHAGAPHPSGDGGPSEVPGSQPGPQYYNNNNNNNNNSPQQQEGGYTYPPRYTQPSHQRIASDSSWVSEEGNGGGDPGQPGYYNDGGRSDYYRGVRGGSIGGGSYRR